MLKIDSKQVIHIVSEIIIMLTMSFYFSYQIDNVKKINIKDEKIDDLEKIIQKQQTMINDLMKKTNNLEYNLEKNVQQIIYRK